jgi:subtilisin
MPTNRISIDSVMETLLMPINHSPESIGLPHMDVTGDGTKICLLDCGTPRHKDIVNIAEDINFSGSAEKDDLLGHSTVISGLIVGSGGIMGIAPSASMYFAKVIDDTCASRIDSLIAGILWGIIKEVNVICIPLSTDFDSPAVHDAIKKAHNRKITIVASAGNTKDILYPAKYHEVLPVGAIDQNGAIASAPGNINLIGTRQVSCYLENKYAVATGSSVATAYAAGIAALLIESCHKKKIDPTPATIYKMMQSLPIQI